MAKKIIKDVAQIDLFAELNARKTTQEQKDFIELKERISVILSAVAGSGKTFCCVERLKKMIADGVDPSRIIFFSFTNAATEELQKRMGRDDVKITTIHSFCSSILTRTGKYKNITNFYDFVKWFRESHKPSSHATQEEREEFYNNIHDMYNESELLSSKITGFKLAVADGVKAGPMPRFFLDYEQFQRETRARDFSDMLIEVNEMFKQEKWLNMFKGKYDYIFVDEFQDTSTIQLRILLALNAKYYYLIGDEFQAIYGFSSSDPKTLIAMLRARRKVKEMTLTVNFRSDVSIVENANSYSDLKAIPNSPLVGDIDYTIRTSIDDLVQIMDRRSEVAVLVRTNDVIAQLEMKLLSMRYPMRYMNYFSKRDLDEIKTGKANPPLQRKISSMVPQFFSSAQELLMFIKINQDQKKFITTIHKSKGREFDCCVVVNSIAPEILVDNGFVLPKKEHKKVSFDRENESREEQNVHYVAVTRPRHELFYMLYGKV